MFRRGSKWSTDFAFAALFPLIIGDFDLSIGLLVGFLAVAGAKLAQYGLHPATLVHHDHARRLHRHVNGFLVVGLRISAFIATLATGIILGALSNGISNGQIISTNLRN